MSHMTMKSGRRRRKRTSKIKNPSINDEMTAKTKMSSSAKLKPEPSFDGAVCSDSSAICEVNEKR